MKHGRGREIMPDGEVFCGIFKNDLRNGYGVAKNVSRKYSYEGEYLNGG